MSIKKLTLSDNDVRGLVGEILRNIALQGNQYDLIVGITRGGLVPAVMISHYLNTPMLAASWSLRDHARQDRTTAAEIVTAINKGSRVLVVDDICDNGNTLVDLHREIHAGLLVERFQLDSAVLVHNEDQRVFEPSYHGMCVNKQQNPLWVEFPWETWWR